MIVPQVLSWVSCCPVPHCQNLLALVFGRTMGQRWLCYGASVLALLCGINTLLRPGAVT